MNGVKKKRKIDARYKLKLNVQCAVVASIRNYRFFNSKVERLKGHVFDHLPYNPDELKVLFLSNLP